MADKLIVGPVRMAAERWAIFYWRHIWEYPLEAKRHSHLLTGHARALHDLGFSDEADDMELLSDIAMAIYADNARL